MPKPVCVKCRRFFRPKTNGYAWVEGMPDPSDTPPGTAHPEGWRPYKLWNSDLWECQGCGNQIIVGHTSTPIAEHYQDGFAGMVKRYGAELQVNDC